MSSVLCEWAFAITCIAFACIQARLNYMYFMITLMLHDTELQPILQGWGIPLQVINRLLYSCWQLQCLRNLKVSQTWRLSYLMPQLSCPCQYNLSS